jgi:biotin operon repressor
MPRGRKTSFTIRLTPAQRQTLRALQRSTGVSAGMARRSRILLLLADGVTITDIAAKVGMSRQKVYKWIRRFAQEGVEGLTDRTAGRHRSEPHLPDRQDQSDVDMVF